MNLSAPDSTVIRTAMSYSDINGLKGISDVDRAAEQFESVFVDMWLKSVRDANRVFSEGNYTSSQGVEMQQEMLDKQWSIHIAENGGIGLKEVIVRQLRGQATAVQSQQLTPRPSVQLMALSNAPSFEHNFVTRLNAIVKQSLSGSELNPTAVTAQAVLETGWGKHIVHDSQGRTSYNLFGIKAGNNWQGPTVSSRTTEYEGDQPVSKTERFRRYDSLSDAVADYRQLVTGSTRYHRLTEFVDNAFAYADELQQAGYATDPQYAAKVKQVIEQLRTNYGLAI